MQRAQERLYLTADKGRVVREGDPKAAFLYAALGDEIPENAAEKFGLVDGRLKAKGKGTETLPTPKPETPLAPKPEEPPTPKPEEPPAKKPEAKKAVAKKAAPRKR